MGERRQVARSTALDVGTSTDQQLDTGGVFILDGGMERVPDPAFRVYVRAGIEQAADCLSFPIAGGFG
jgi:hypothetical protein